MSNNSRKRSSVWQNFICEDESGVRCKHCMAKVRTSKGATSNMHRHLLRNHSSVCGDFNSASGKNPQPFSDKDVDLLAYMLIKNFEPTNIVESGKKEKFLQLLGGTDLQLTATTNSINSVIEKRFSKYCQLFASRIKDFDSYSVSLDLSQDDSDQQSLLVTLHFTNTVASFESKVLDLLYVDGSPSAEHLIQLIEDTFGKWGVERLKIVALVTGCDPVLIKAALAFVDSKKHIICIAQLVDGLVERALASITHETKTIEKMQTFLNCEWKGKESKDLPSIAITTARSKEWSTKKKCPSLSFFKLVQLFKQIQHSVDAACGSDGFTDKEMSFLHDLAVLGEAFLAFVTEISTSYYVESSVVLPLLNCGLKAIRNTVVLTDSGIRMQNTIIADFSNLLLDLSNKEVLAVATILDPAYKTLHFVTKKSLELVLAAVEECLLETPDETRREEPSRKISNMIWVHHASMYEDFVKRYQGEEFERYLSMPLCKDRSDAKLFWKVNRPYFPKLFHLARKFRSIPATSFLPGTLFSESQSSLYRKLFQLSSQAVKKYLVLHDLTFEEWQALSE